MPLPDRLARINRYVTNPVFRTFAGRVSPFAIVLHRGRTSGRAYRTPIIAFVGVRDAVIALTYGPNRDWVKNVQAARGCSIIQRGKTIPLSHPEIVVGDAGMHRMPAIARPILRLNGVDHFLRLRRVAASGSVTQ